MEALYRCLVCGFLGHTKRPYEKSPDHVYPLTVQPPYTVYWGEPSYEPCACCGFEPGNDDSFGITLPQYLEEWFVGGMKWFEPELKPAEWDIVKQLQEANIPIPEFIKVSRQLT